MPYITREDGEHFVIPSYRDVLTVKQTSQLKKEILLLSKSYGEFITLQKKSATQYEVAFSPDTGYLLGESIWHQFNKPLDLIYCEAIPNTTEAILVIVKSGSVYIDGSFPLDSIPEELIIFLTQQNNFEIYTYGDVPISQEPEAGKFSFEQSSVKSFTILDKPVFPTLPLLKSYQLQLVDPVLKAQGIGVFPTAQVVGVVALLAIAWIGWSFFKEEKKEVVVVKEEVSPYKLYYDTIMSSAAPDDEIGSLSAKVKSVLQIPGWVAKDIVYSRNAAVIQVQSKGGKMADLYAWGEANKITVLIKQTGVYLSVYVPTKRMPARNTITPIPKLIAAIVDRVSTVLPGNRMTIGKTDKKGVFSKITISINFNGITPSIFDLLGQQFANMPVVLHDVKIGVKDNGMLDGTLTIEGLGN